MTRTGLTVYFPQPSRDARIRGSTMRGVENAPLRGRSANWARLAHGRPGAHRARHAWRGTLVGNARHSYRRPVLVAQALFCHVERVLRRSSPPCAAMSRLPRSASPTSRGAPFPAVGLGYSNGARCGRHLVRAAVLPRRRICDRKSPASRRDLVGRQSETALVQSRNPKYCRLHVR